MYKRKRHSGGRYALYAEKYKLLATSFHVVQTLEFIRYHCLSMGHIHKATGATNAFRISEYSLLLFWCILPVGLPYRVDLYSVISIEPLRQWISVNTCLVSAWYLQNRQGNWFKRE